MTNICSPGELEILHKWCSTCISACGYAGTPCQLLPEGAQRCLREFSNLDTCKVFYHTEIIYRLCNNIPKLSKACLWSFWLPGMLCQLLPEGACGDSGLLTKGRVVTSICKPQSQPGRPQSLWGLAGWLWGLQMLVTTLPLVNNPESPLAPSGSSWSVPGS